MHEETKRPSTSPTITKVWVMLKGGPFDRRRVQIEAHLTDNGTQYSPVWKMAEERRMILKFPKDGIVPKAAHLKVFEYVLQEDEWCNPRGTGLKVYQFKE